MRPTVYRITLTQHFGEHAASFFIGDSHDVFCSFPPPYKSNKEANHDAESELRMLDIPRQSSSKFSTSQQKSHVKTLFFLYLFKRRHVFPSLSRLLSIHHLVILLITSPSIFPNHPPLSRSCSYSKLVYLLPTSPNCLTLIVTPDFCNLSTYLSPRQLGVKKPPFANFFFSCVSPSNKLIAPSANRIPVNL